MNVAMDGQGFVSFPALNSSDRAMEKNGDFLPRIETIGAGSRMIQEHCARFVRGPMSGPGGLKSRVAAGSVSER